MTCIYPPVFQIILSGPLRRTNGSHISIDSGISFRASIKRLLEVLFPLVELTAIYPAIFAFVLEPAATYQDYSNRIRCPTGDPWSSDKLGIEAMQT